MKDLTTGKVYVPKAFREVHGKEFARLGIDLSKPQPAGRLLDAWVDLLPPGAAEAIAKHLGLLEDEKTPDSK